MRTLTSLVASEVGREVVDVDEDTRVGRLVSTREVDGGWAGSTRATNVKLEARHVELGSAGAAGNMQSCQKWGIRTRDSVVAVNGTYQ